MTEDVAEEQPPPPPAAPAPVPAPATPSPTWSVRRTARTAQSDAWDLVGTEGDRAGSVTVQYLTPGVEGMLALAGDVDDDHRRALLAWLTDTLGLDAAAGPGGLIHWVTVAGEPTDYWRRAPGRRPSGAEQDIAAVKARIEGVLAQLSLTWGPSPDGDIAVDVGSVRVFVAIRLVDATVAVRIFAITNLDMTAEGELPAYLLGVNFGTAIGRFSLDRAHGAVWFDHVLAGEEIDESSLARVISAVASTADQYDDEIKARFGGRTFREGGSPVEEAAKLPSPGIDMAGGYL